MIRSRGFTFIEAVLAIFLIGLVMGMVGVLFHKSFGIMRMLDDKERSRQASRMGLDRITSELREATEILEAGTDFVSFEKINPNADIVLPPVPPNPETLEDDYEPPDWSPLHAYPLASRLEIRYEVEDETLMRVVQSRSGGTAHRQVVVVGINSFTCQVSAENPAEVDVSLSVLDNRRVVTISSRIMAPCIVEEFE